VSVQFYVYEMRGEESEAAHRLSWDGWRPVAEWLDEAGIDAEGRMARRLEYREVRQVLQETAGVTDEVAEVYVAPLPNLTGATMMFGLVCPEADYVVAPVEMTWLLPQAVHGWQAALTFSVERIGGRNSEGYFREEQ